ncbi:hypothetical protein [Geobacter sp.]|uniref:hypothetical protein n=1 Tax=Geobacter sp. TaxID=46610 RepID=UPI0027BAE800|nr:hypothetical protein [Geobacter sp.]
MSSKQEMTKGDEMRNQGEERVLKLLSELAKDIADFLPAASEGDRARLFCHMTSRITGGRISICEAQVLWGPASA